MTQIKRQPLLLNEFNLTCIKDHAEKHLIIIFGNTIINPLAMMIHFQPTSITLWTMMCSWRFRDVTFLTKSFLNHFFICILIFIIFFFNIFFCIKINNTSIFIIFCFKCFSWFLTSYLFLFCQSFFFFLLKDFPTLINCFLK